MNNLDKITEKIIADSNDKSFIILEETEKRIKDIKNENIEKINKKIEEMNKNFASAKELEIERINSSTELKIRNIKLTDKQDMIKEIFTKIVDVVDNISETDLISYVNSNLEKRKIREDEIVFIPKKYENCKNKINAKNVEVLNDLKSGFLIEKNGVQENYSFEALLEYNKEEIEMKINEKLFK